MVNRVNKLMYDALKKNRSKEEAYYSLMQLLLTLYILYVNIEDDHAIFHIFTSSRILRGFDIRSHPNS